MRINMPFGFIGSFRSSGKKHFLLALKSGSVLVVGTLLVASCASSSSEQQQTATETPATTAAPEPPVETTAPASPPEETSPPPPQSATPDTGAAVAACVGELAAMASAENVPEEDQAAMTSDWEATCAQFVPQLVGVAESARQFGADSACVDRVLANAMATPFAFFNAYSASAQNAQGDEPQWGQFSECMS